MDSEASRYYKHEWLKEVKIFCTKPIGYTDLI